jgi:hypothetical protein
MVQQKLLLEIFEVRRAKQHDTMWRNANTLTDYCNLQYAEMHTQKYLSSVKLESTLYYVRADN